MARGMTLIVLPTLLAGCSRGAREQTALANALGAARAPDGGHIGWREHVIDDRSTGGDELRGGDGLQIGDLDKDGYLDVVSVHESDTEYDNVPDGLIRIAFGSSDPNHWVNVTLARGLEAAAPEDVALADLNADGFLDIVVACELAHIIYFENPGSDVRVANWKRVIPSVTTNRGSFIRVFVADLTGDGVPEVIAANKGAQNPSGVLQPTAISWFETKGTPLSGNWIEHELTRVRWPINSYPVDLDGDGDIDVLGGSVAERQILWCENLGGGRFRTSPLLIRGTSISGHARPDDRRRDDGPLVNGFHMDLADMNGDNRLDIVTFESAAGTGPRGIVGRALVWLEQPTRTNGEWRLHVIGDYTPDDVVGLTVADINGDARPDVMSGGYSAGPRDSDGELPLDEPSGRLAWFENTGAGSDRWIRHDISRRRRGMFDQFVARDMDGDGDLDFLTTRGNSATFDGVFWLEQMRTTARASAFTRARAADSPEIPLPATVK